MLLLQVHPAFFKVDIWTFHNRKSTGVNINNFPFLLRTWQWASMLNTRTWNWSCWMIFIIKLIIYMSSHGRSKCRLCKKADCDVFDLKTTFLIKALNWALVSPFSIFIKQTIWDLLLWVWFHDEFDALMKGQEKKKLLCCYLNSPFHILSRRAWINQRRSKTPYQSAVMSACVHLRIRKRIYETEGECLI